MPRLQWHRRKCLFWRRLQSSLLPGLQQIPEWSERILLKGKANQTEWNIALDKNEQDTALRSQLFSLKLQAANKTAQKAMQFLQICDERGIDFDASLSGRPNSLLPQWRPRQNGHSPTIEKCRPSATAGDLEEKEKLAQEREMLQSENRAQHIQYSVVIGAESGSIFSFNICLFQFTKPIENASPISGQQPVPSRLVLLAIGPMNLSVFRPIYIHLMDYLPFIVEGSAQKMPLRLSPDDPKIRVLFARRNRKMKILAIGCAPTTLGFAYRLNELKKEGVEGADEVELLILEQAPLPGGLSGTVQDENGFLWDMGGHITFSHNFPYYEKATREAVKEWNSLERNCMVDLNYLYGEKGINLVPYPAQFAVPLFPDDIKRQCLAELKERYEEKDAPSNPPADFEEWILHHFGPKILEVFFKPYTKKVWTVDTAKMSPNWVGTRVAKLPQEKLEELCEMGQEELKKADFGWGPNAHFNFPKYGGTGAVWEQMAGMLPSHWFKYNAKVTRVEHSKKRLFYLNGATGEQQMMRYDALINSSPIDQFVADSQICTPLRLEHNKVIIVGIGLELPFTEFCKKFTWLYFPDPDVPFYRVTFFSRYGEVTPDNSKYWSVMCECARQSDDPLSEEEIRDRAIDGLIVKSIIKRDQIVSIYSVTLPYGYPIPTIQRDSELARAHEVLERNQIYSRGRFGGWKYEVSNQDHCFIQGKELCERLVLGQPEKLYKTLVPEKRG